MFSVFPPRMVSCSENRISVLSDINPKADKLNNTVASGKPLTMTTTGAMDDLVSAIRENLKLKSHGCRSCGGGVSRHSRRVSPYSITSRADSMRRASNDRCSCNCLSQRNPSPRNSAPEDPYELLQVLLKQGTLISEAVRRLQDPQKSFSKPREILRSPSSVDSCVSCDSSPTSSGFMAACAAT